MLRKVLIVVAALAMIPAVARADFQAGNWELTLGGGGSSNRGLTQGSFNVNAGLGYFLTKDLEISLRQAVSYSDFNNGTTVAASTRVAGDWHFDLGNFKPFVGGNLGYTYGSHGVTNTWEVAPEAGVKYFVNSTTFLFGLVEYQIFFRNGNGPSFNKGSFVYSLGLGVVLK